RRGDGGDGGDAGRGGGGAAADGGEGDSEQVGGDGGGGGGDAGGVAAAEGGVGFTIRIEGFFGCAGPVGRRRATWRQFDKRGPWSPLLPSGAERKVDERSVVYAIARRATP